MKRVGIVLSGCGVYDGSEIHEAVLTLLALDRAAHKRFALRQISHNYRWLIT